jgi:hypothetical protein
VWLHVFAFFMYLLLVTAVIMHDEHPSPCLAHLRLGICNRSHVEKPQNSLLPCPGCFAQAESIYSPTSGIYHLSYKSSLTNKGNQAVGI